VSSKLLKVRIEMFQSNSLVDRVMRLDSKLTTALYKSFTNLLTYLLTYLDAVESRCTMFREVNNIHTVI